ncbi:MAG TPA: MgtC/SapB family protein [Phycisphaerales bacterium]|nr:MgtC/SapB family protein [Phycisphaerales bacterium]
MPLPADAAPVMPLSTILLRLGVSMLFGAIIGINRQRMHKPAGLRTLMLVCVGACTFTLLPIAYHTPGGEAMTTADMSRIIQGVVGGIGFLGAGVIIHSGTRTAGITTAAAVWLTAAVGVAIGAGQIRLGIAAGVAAILTLSIVGRLEGALFKDPQPPGPDECGPADPPASSR